MNYLFILPILILTTWNCPAQDHTRTAVIETEVDLTLWSAFKEAYDTKNAKAFNALHTEDVMRITPNSIRIGEEYTQSIARAFSLSPERAQSIDFAMEHRVYSGIQGYEVGFYRIIYSVDGVVVGTSYARFHVRLRKVGAEWKIAQDWDIHHINGEEITKEVFEKADFLELEE